MRSNHKRYGVHNRWGRSASEQAGREEVLPQQEQNVAPLKTNIPLLRICINNLGRGPEAPRLALHASSKVPTWTWNQLAALQEDMLEKWDRREP